MKDKEQIERPVSDPFGMGRQGYIIIAIIVLASALFAATRRDWATMLVSALVLPLAMVAVIHLLSWFWRRGSQVRDKHSGPRRDVDLLSFVARTNPIMLLFYGALSRGVDDERYQELLRSGPYGMGQYGYLLALLVLLAPLILALIITAVTGQIPAHGASHFP